MGCRHVSLWLARHARPLIASGTCYGALDVAADPALTLAAAQALAGELPQRMGVQVSPLQRCQQLADALQGLRPDLFFATDAGLREMDFGSWEGVAWADIPRAAVEAWTADFATHCFGGKESANDVLVRVSVAWDARKPGADTLWITHAGVAQAAALLQAGTRHVAQASDWPTTGLPCGGWITLPG